MPRPNNITLSDVARETGVSKVTASHILNARSGGTSTVRVSENTRTRVLAAARAMGYRPNALARGLARRRTDTITLVMQSPAVFSGGSGFVSEMMHGVVQAANGAGFDLMLHTKAQPDTEADLRALLDGRSDGALVLRDCDDPVIAGLAERSHPLMLIFSRGGQAAPQAPFVDVDNVRGGQIATEYLLSLGHRRIAFLSGSPASAAVVDRRVGYGLALENAGLPVPPPASDPRMNYAGAAPDALIDLMRQPASLRPTAIFAWSDDVALRAINVLRTECGLCVPDHVSVVGFDGTEALCERSSPRLTSICQPIKEIAARAVVLLAAQINQSVEDYPQELFTPVLVVRDSCAPIKADM